MAFSALRNFRLPTGETLGELPQNQRLFGNVSSTRPFAQETSNRLGFNPATQFAVQGGGTRALPDDDSNFTSDQLMRLQREIDRGVANRADDVSEFRAAQRARARFRRNEEAAQALADRNQGFNTAINRIQSLGDLNPGEAQDIQSVLNQSGVNIQPQNLTTSQLRSVVNEIRENRRVERAQGNQTREALLSQQAAAEQRRQEAAAALPTGLLGAEQALQGAFSGAAGAIDRGINQARGDITGARAGALADIGQSFGQAQNILNTLRTDANEGFAGEQARFNQFAEEGAGASQQQAALSGALGPNAQRQAFADFAESPGQAFLRERAERALTRNAAATGGLRGGNVLSELQRQAMGFAQQDLNNQFERLGQVANRGFQAAGQQAGLGSQNIGLLAQLGGDRANLASQQGQISAGIRGESGNILAQLANQLGTGIADAGLQTGSQLANARLQTGNQLANVLGNSNNLLAQLLQQQGSGAANIIGSNTGALGSGLAQVGTAAGGQVSGLPGLPQLQAQPGILGQIGGLASGVGSVLSVPGLLGGGGGGG